MDENWIYRHYYSCFKTIIERLQRNQNLKSSKRWDMFYFKQPLSLLGLLFDTKGLDVQVFIILTIHDIFSEGSKYFLWSHTWQMRISPHKTRLSFSKFMLLLASQSHLSHLNNYCLYIRPQKVSWVKDKAFAHLQRLILHIYWLKEVLSSLPFPPIS